MSLRGARNKQEFEKAAGRVSTFAPPPRTRAELGNGRELSRSSSARTLQTRTFSASAREPNSSTRAASSSRERSSRPSRTSIGRGQRSVSPSQVENRPLPASPQSETRRGRCQVQEQHPRTGEDISRVMLEDFIKAAPPGNARTQESPLRQRGGKTSVKINSPTNSMRAAHAEGSVAAVDVDVSKLIDAGTGAATQEHQQATLLPDLQSQFKTPDSGGFAGSGLNLREECEQLRDLLAVTNRQIEETVQDVSEQQALMKERQAIQQEEAVSLLEELRVLSSENKKLQVGARDSRNATWKLQAALKAREGNMELSVEEASERQKRLEQENARLRKEASALKARVLGWRRHAAAQQRNKSPGDQRATLRPRQPKQAPPSSPVRTEMPRLDLKQGYADISLGSGMSDGCQEFI